MRQSHVVPGEISSDDRHTPAQATLANPDLIGMRLLHLLGDNLGSAETEIDWLRHQMEMHGCLNDQVNVILNGLRNRIVEVLKEATAFHKELLQVQIEVDEPRGSYMLTDIVSDVVVRSQPIIPNISFAVAIDERISVYAVRGQVMDILRALVVNAVQAMPGGGHVSISAVGLDNLVELRVSDTGSGIAQEEIHRIFELFYSTKLSLGFGLWNARRLAIMNDGYLSVESRIGAGSTFILALPAGLTL